jgi:hypothetical protein
MNVLPVGEIRDLRFVDVFFVHASTDILISHCPLVRVIVCLDPDHVPFRVGISLTVWLGLVDWVPHVVRGRSQSPFAFPFSFHAATRHF